MKNLDKLVESLHLNNHLLLEELPNLDLYMDQVIQIFESNLEKTKRKEDDKVITKTMINNYAKGKLFFPIENKKYTKKHIILISLIYQLKGALSIQDIKMTLEKLNEKIVDEDLELEKIYQSYVRLTESQVERFLDDIQIGKEEVMNEVTELGDEDSNYLEQLLFISTLVNMSNFYRRLAEKLVDEMNSSESN